MVISRRRFAENVKEMYWNKKNLKGLRHDHGNSEDNVTNKYDWLNEEKIIVLHAFWLFFDVVCQTTMQNFLTWGSPDNTGS